MPDRKNLVRVTIGGEEYSLRSDRSEDYTRAVAEHVDRAIAEAKALGVLVESHKAVVLAALAITDELFQARLTARELEQRMSQLTDSLSRFLPPNKRPSRSSGAFASSGDEG